ncbi:MAG: 4-alpha-glucanotransferase, partial [Pseudomonadota bacterium]
GLLGRASSELVALQLDDIYSEGEQQNVPGTVEEYPNWCRRTALSLERLAGSGELAQAARTMSARMAGAGDEGRDASVGEAGHRSA